MIGEIEDRVPLYLERVGRLEPTARKADQVNVMTLRSVSDARPDDLARSGVQAGQQESKGGTVIGFHDENSLLLKYSLLWNSGSSVFGGKKL